MDSRKLSIISLTSLAHFMNDSTALLYSFLIIYYTTDYHVSIVFLGAVSVAYTLISGLASPPIGDFADRRDLDAPLMAAGILIEAAAVALFGFSFVLTSEIYELVALAAVALGLGQAFYHPIGGAILSRSFGGGAGTLMGINGSMGSLGRAIMPSLVAGLVFAYGLPGGIGLFSVVLFASALVVLFGLRFYRKGQLSGDIRAKKEKMERRYYRFLIVFGAIIFIRSMFITGTTTFLGEFVYRLYLSKALAAAFLTVSFMGPVLGQPVFGMITERRGGYFSFSLSSLLSVFSFALFLVFAKNFVLSLAFYTIMAFAVYNAFPVLLGYVSQVFPRRFLTVVNSYVWGVGNVAGGAAGNALMTLLLGRGFSILEGFYANMILAVVSTVMVFLLPKLGIQASVKGASGK